MAEKYITEEQRAGCRKVADAFAELYELTDVVVADAIDAPPNPLLDKKSKSYLFYFKQ